MSNNETNQLSFPSVTENLTLVDKLIDKVCEVYTISEDYYGNILVAVTEAVNNAIQHGNQANPEKQVGISYQAKENSIVFRIEDQGPGFDYSNLPDPTDPANLEKPNGRGIFLMKNLADEVEFLEEGRIVELNFQTNALTISS